MRLDTFVFVCFFGLVGTSLMLDVECYVTKSKQSIEASASYYSALGRARTADWFRTALLGLLGISFMKGMFFQTKNSKIMELLATFIAASVFITVKLTVHPAVARLKQNPTVEACETICLGHLLSNAIALFGAVYTAWLGTRKTHAYC
eukprot:TRINITY_DN67293_c6_g3_i3.p1 TRINITY_DN67293_c6_g3~~TRINITY_DN67293_c6_g3_i3.p1  ORF type:complete len:156 (+),score=0.90 TRINITY_DN67293_c6_g3_i3:26-469(+)